MKKMKILIISLPGHTHRRAEIQKQFSKQDLVFEFCDGVDGSNLTAKEYFELAVAGRSHVLTPGELGCTLSHREVLRKIVERNEASVILEDDVILANVALLDKFLSRELLDGTIYMLGGQDGLRRARLLKGVRKGLITRYSFRYAPLFQRTCCYAVTPNTARAILDYQTYDNLKLADDWGKIVKNAKLDYIEFWPIFEHPLDLDGSVIERERLRK